MAKKRATKKRAAKKRRSKARTSPATATNADSGKMRVLAIDGGGILGLTTAHYLKALQERVRRPLRECFEFVAGTSTGSILAVAIGANIDIDDVIELYVERGPEIFPGGLGGALDGFGRLFTQGVSKPKYSDGGLERALREELVAAGRPLLFGELAPRIMVTAYDTIERRAWVFKSWRSWLHDVEAWEIVKGSCSAPTYFPGHALSMLTPVEHAGEGVFEHRRFSLVDGGVWANNPAGVALAEALRENTYRRRARRSGEEVPTPVDTDEFVVASFGNIENAAKPISAEEAREWGALEWVKRGDLIGVMMDGAHETCAYMCGSVIPDDRFFRFGVQVRGAEEHRMDDASPDHLAELRELARAYVHQPDVQTRLDELAALLTA